MEKNKKRINIYTIILVAIVVLVYIIINPRLCIIKIITGLPCPACGMTRAFYYFFTFDLGKAFYYHPLFPLAFVAIFLFVLQLFKKELLKSKVITGIYIAFTIIFVAVYIVRMVLYFPNVAPLDYDYNSLIGIIIKAITGK